MIYDIFKKPPWYVYLEQLRSVSLVCLESGFGCILLFPFTKWLWSTGSTINTEVIKIRPWHNIPVTRKIHTTHDLDAEQFTFTLLWRCKRRDLHQTITFERGTIKLVTNVTGNPRHKRDDLTTMLGRLGLLINPRELISTNHWGTTDHLQHGGRPDRDWSSLDERQVKSGRSVLSQWDIGQDKNEFRSSLTNTNTRRRIGIESRKGM